MDIQMYIQTEVQAFVRINVSTDQYTDAKQGMINCNNCRIILEMIFFKIDEVFIKKTECCELAPPLLKNVLETLQNQIYFGCKNVLKRLQKGF